MAVLPEGPSAQRPMKTSEYLPVLVSIIVGLGLSQVLFVVFIIVAGLQPG